MKYDLASPHELESAFDYLTKLSAKEAEVEVKRVQPGRSLNQNNFLHLILTAFGMHFGYTLEEAKQVYKQLNKDIYEYKRKGRVFYRSSADLNKEEMAQTIDRFMQASAEQGCELPMAINQDWLRSISNEAERTKYH